jgi:hypothetical protein
MRRSDCLDWMKDNGYSKPPRSACTFCPFHSMKEWRELKKNKEEWDEIVAAWIRLFVAKNDLKNKDVGSGNER